jgi:diguanylate cyclase (GGDEF)-like protein
MSTLVDHLARLTGFRDRDVLDVTLVGALRDILHSKEIAIHRRVGDVGNEHWLTRARLAAGDVAATADPAWTELADLPTLDDRPAWRDCLRSQSVMVRRDGDTVVTLFPLSTDRDVFGVLDVHTIGELSHEQLRSTSGVLRIYHNFLSLLDYSERDTLTGLLNRKTFDESFLKTLSQTVVVSRTDDARRTHSENFSYWIGVIDIDHFKRINDNFGHLIGDEVLLLLSRLMHASFRFQDRLYRFGGEEFVVLMRCGNAADALLAFERLRTNVERYVFPQVGQLTVSVGFTQVQFSDTPAAAFERADKAVYHAKTHGRNQVCSHAVLLADGVIADAAKTGEVELF